MSTASRFKDIRPNLIRPISQAFVKWAICPLSLYRFIARLRYHAATSSFVTSRQSSTLALSFEPIASMMDILSVSSVYTSTFSSHVVCCPFSWASARWLKKSNGVMNTCESLFGRKLPSVLSPSPKQGSKCWNRVMSMLKGIRSKMIMRSFKDRRCRANMIVRAPTSQLAAAHSATSTTVARWKLRKRRQSSSVKPSSWDDPFIKCCSKSLNVPKHRMVCLSWDKFTDSQSVSTPCSVRSFRSHRRRPSL